MNLKRFKKLSGDASFRQFFRTNNSILVFSRIQKQSNLLNYDAVNKILVKSKILAPNLISQNYKKNFIEIDDFGNKNMLDKIKSSKNKLNEYKKILKILELKIFLKKVLIYLFIQKLSYLKKLIYFLIGIYLQIIQLIKKRF